MKKTVFLGFKEISKKIVPIIECYERTDIFLEGSMEFYCIFCKKTHRHGKGNGHRIAHCSNIKSPFIETGYIINLKKSNEDK